MYKKIFLTLIVALVLAGTVSAGPQLPYMVYGKAFVDGTIAPGMTIKLTDVSKSTSKEYVSLSGGDWGLNLADFDSGYSDGDSLKITYCIDDTRCNERDITGLTVGSSGNKYGMVKNIEATQDASGGSSPFVLYGSIVKDGTAITTGTVTIKNTNTAESKTIDIASDGYQFNLANFGSGYNTGDTIEVTYSAYTFNFIVSGGGKKFDLIIITSTTTPPSSGDSGSNNQGGSGAPVVNEGKDIKLADTPISFEGIEKSQFNINIGGETHTITLFRIYVDSAEIWIQSEPVKILLDIGQSRTVDIDGDGIKDVKVYLESILNGLAKISIMNVEVDPEDGQPAPGEADGEVNLPDNTRDYPEPSKGGNSGTWLFALALVIVLAIIGYIYYRTREKEA